MRLNDNQVAVLTIQLSGLGQISLDNNDPETLQILEDLLTMALANVRNVRNAIKKQEVINASTN